MDPDLIERFYRAEHSFTVDPVDGTANFVNVPGLRRHGCRTRHGDPVRSWIWQPGHGVAFTAEKGGCVPKQHRLKTARLTRTFPPGAGDEPEVTQEGEAVPLSRLHSAWWCCGVDYPNVAMGRVDFARLQARDALGPRARLVDPR